MEIRGQQGWGKHTDHRASRACQALVIKAPKYPPLGRPQPPPVHVPQLDTWNRVELVLLEVGLLERT